MKEKKRVRVSDVVMTIVACVAGLFIIGVAVYNAVINDKFWEMSLFQVMTLLATIFLAFFLSQKLTDDRRREAKAESLLLIIQQELQDSRFTDMNSQEDVEYVGIKNRRIANTIDCLKKISSRVGITEGVGIIKEKFDRYEELYGNHVTDLVHLQSSKIDFENIVVCIKDECERMIVSFYE